MKSQKIQDYGVIGNGRSTALIGRNGSIDWLCWPRHDSPSIFGRLLDIEKGGFWQIHPSENIVGQHQYIKDTNVLETHFENEKGKIILTDFMTVLSEKNSNKQLLPQNELIRSVICTQGEMDIEIHFQPSPNYAQDKTILKDLRKLGLRFEVGRELYSLHCSEKLTVYKHKAFLKKRLKKGDSINFSFTYTIEGPAVLPPTDNDFINNKLKQTIDWWQAWAQKADYKGPYRNIVIRSALALKLLGYAPSGAFIAAPTSSLPEQVGGPLNWDYRYCWLRDASFTVRALLGLGYKEEAGAFVSWILHSTRLTQPKLKVVYDVFGEAIPEEIVLPKLSGYLKSKPVHIGNATQNQIQLDIYGEVIDGVFNFYKNNKKKMDKETRTLLTNIAKYVCKNWNLKDCGLWEEGEDIDHYTFSKVQCWVALDKILKMQNRCQLSKNQIKDFESHREKIRNEIEQKGWNESLQSYTSTFGGSKMDASLLLLPYFEFDKANSQRMKQTYKSIEEKLGSDRPELIYRYEKRLGKEGAFLLCTMWKIDFILRGGGSISEAKKIFDDFLKCGTDLNLFAEEADSKTRLPLGNFPQAFTHLGIINIALLLKEKKND